MCEGSRRVGGSRETHRVTVDFVFEDPWEPTVSSDFLKAQVEAELTPPHPLYGQVVRTLAIRADSDDVLVQTVEGFALVHLSWCRRSRPTPDFPHTRFFSDWEEFCREVYQADILAWQQENPPNEWDRLIREAAEEGTPLAAENLP